MSPFESLTFAAFVALALILVTWLTFALGTLFEGFPRLRLKQILGIVAVSAFLLAVVAALGRDGGPAVLIFSPILFSLLMFTRMWANEFRLLMLRKADEFPTPSDKLAWIFVLTAMAPAGVWLFRSYRRVQWPDILKENRPHPLDELASGVEPAEMHRIGA